MKTVLLLLTIFSALVGYAQNKDWPISKDITLVYITDKTIDELGSFPFNRNVYADYLNALYDQYDPAVAYMDLFFVDPNKDLPESDVSLAESVKGKDNLVFGAMVGERDINLKEVQNSAWLIIPSRSSRTYKGALFPLPGILENGATAAMSSITLNSEGYYDTFPTLWVIDSNAFPSVPLELTQAYAGFPDSEQGAFVRAVSKKNEAGSWGDFKIDYNHRFQQIQMQDILNGTADPDLINGRIVILGGNFSGGVDMKPIGRNYLIPGTELIANATQTLLDTFRIKKAP